MASKTLKVEIVGDASSLSKTFKQAGDVSTGFGSSLGKLAKYGALAAGAAGIGGLALVLKVGIGEFAQGTKVAAQTNAVLKSTGGIANVTARQVDALAASQMRKTGADDEAVKTGENMLLTFTDIRNQVGKNNDIFTQATKITQDMATAMNGGAIPSSEQMAKQAILVGKALNDPITGMSALHRVGVAFTDDQKKQVAAMMKAGDTMGAQKIVLGELNKEFGGSAEAIGKTLPGQISILKESFNNLAGDIVAGLMPTFQQLVAWTSAHGPEISQLLTSAFDLLGKSINDVITIGKALLAFYKEHTTLVQITAGAIAGMVVAVETITTVTKTWAAAQLLLNAALVANPIGLIVVGLAALGGALVVAYTRSETFRNIVNGAFTSIKTTTLAVVNEAKALWARFGGDVMAAAGIVAGQVHRIVAAVSSVITLVGDLVHGRWSKIWDDVKAVAVNALNAMYGLFYEAGKHIVTGFVNGIKSLAADAGKAAANVAKSAYDSAKHFLHIGSPSKLFHQMGVDTMLGYINGIVSMGARAGSAMVKVMGFVAADARRGVGEVIRTVEGEWSKAVVTLGKIVAQAMSPTMYKTASGAPLADWIVQNAIDASLAANPNASTGGLMPGGFDPSIWATIPGNGGIPKMATGGMLLSDGLIFAHRGERVTPAKVAHGGGGGVINVTVNGWVGSDQAIAEKVRRELIRIGQRGNTSVLGGLA